MQEELIQLNIDTVSYKTKAAAAAEYGKIRSRLGDPGSIRRVTAEGLKWCIEHGLTFMPAVATGTTSEFWQQQQIICIDIDNENFKSKEKLETICSPQDALTILRDQDLTPAIIYKSFSYSEEWPRFRIVFVLSEILEDKKEASELIASLCAVIDSWFLDGRVTDDTSKDINKMYLGSTADSVIYFNDVKTDVSKLRELPKVEEPEEDQPKTKPTYYGYGLRSLEDKLNHDIQSFDLISYLKGEGYDLKRTGNTRYINPCPICGGNNDFQVFRGSWVCYGAKGAGYGKNGRKPGGSIIDLLMITKGTNTGQALEVFKYNLMNYDRREWAREYAAEKREEERRREEEKAARRIREAIKEREGGGNE